MIKNGVSKVPDELSWGILEELQQNARLTAAEIERSVGLSSPAVAESI